MLINWR